MCELNTLKEHGVFGVGVLLGVHDVSANRCNPSCNRSNNAGLVGARDQKNGRRVHSGGDDGNRTHDLLLAKQALYQLSYVPEV